MFLYFIFRPKGRFFYLLQQTRISTTPAVSSPHYEQATQAKWRGAFLPPIQLNSIKFDSTRSNAAHSMKSNLPSCFQWNEIKLFPSVTDLSGLNDTAGCGRRGRKRGLAVLGRLGPLQLQPSHAGDTVHASARRQLQVHFSGWHAREKAFGTKPRLEFAFKCARREQAYFGLRHNRRTVITITITIATRQGKAAFQLSSALPWFPGAFAPVLCRDSFLLSSNSH